MMDVSHTKLIRIRHRQYRTSQHKQFKRCTLRGLRCMKHGLKTY